jgi:hypothetical protein
MRRVLFLGLLLLVAACSEAENRSDGVSPSEARALDNAASKVEAQQLPRDNAQH